jgi:hypothetical protein
VESLRAVLAQQELRLIVSSVTALAHHFLGFGLGQLLLRGVLLL